MSATVKLGKIAPFEFNPRGNIWFKDESRFGHKLLSKMGWSKGKGLGKNEDGIKENIKISKKDNLTGIGYKNDSPIAVGCIEYENILSKLQQRFGSSHPNIKKSNSLTDLESLEQRSRKAKNHLHYQKFVRGKDIIRYSEKEMKCIFLEKPQEIEGEQPKDEIKKEMPTYTSQMSVNDYFAMKMKKKKGPDLKIETEGKNAGEQPCLKSTFSNKKRKNTSENSENLKFPKMEGGEISDETSIIEKQSLEEKCEESNHLNPELSTKIKLKTLKKDKIKKSRLKKLTNLKSCIKKSSAYKFDESRSVSFNEEVAYKIMDTSVENITELNDTTVEEVIQATELQELFPTLEDTSDEYEENVSCSTSDTSTEVKEDISSKNSTIEVQNVINEKEITSDGDMYIHIENKPYKRKKHTSNKEENDFIKETSKSLDLIKDTPSSVDLVEELPKCFDLPKSSGTSFNFWLDSQRQALKMKVYKGMIKNMRKHPILRTTNLLDIKGYGNWVF